MNIFDKANILVPNQEVDMNKWSVIACDQHTSNLAYWQEVKKYVGTNPSTLNLVIPEVYLSEDNSALIKNCNANMSSYIKDEIFIEHQDSLVYVERKLKSGKVRKGLIGVIDLEEYSNDLLNPKHIKPTEALVVSRLPVRVAVRENAILDLPHILLFCNDESKTIIEPLSSKLTEENKIYDFSLNMNGGTIKGYKLPDELADKVITTLNKNINNNKFSLCVADGNHSLAAAKKVYENAKQNNRLTMSKLRYALVELVNLQDEAVDILPIHRILTKINPTDFMKQFETYFSNVITKTKTSNEIKLYGGKVNKTIYFNFAKKDVLLVEEIQKFLDRYIQQYGGDIDYIHDENHLKTLSNNENSIALEFHPIEKQQIVNYVENNKIFPRKTFSVGVEEDKRYYLESRKLF